MRKTQKTTAVVGGTAAAVLIGGVAFAYWTTSGSGSGTGSTTSGAANLTISQTTVLNAMYPGDSAQDLVVNVLNNATNTARVAGVTGYVTTDKEGCDGTDFLLGGSTSSEASPVSLNWTAQELAHGADANATSTIKFNDTGDIQDACKGATVTIHYAAS